MHPFPAMAPSVREVWQGIGAGLLAGVIFAIAEIIGANAAGESTDLVFRHFASLWFGEIIFGVDAIDAPRVADVFLIGGFFHLMIAILAGIVYAVIDTAIASRRPLGLAHRAALGTGYGLLLWVIDFQLLGRVLYPWFLELPQAGQAALHALAFGLPLGVLYAVFDARKRAPSDEPEELGVYGRA